MLNAEKTNWFESGKPQLEAGHKLGKPEILFTKIEDKVIEEQMSKLGVPQNEGEMKTETKELVSFDDFMKTELRVAEIVYAEKIKKSKKLLKLSVNLGNEKRQIVAGIAESYSPEELIGKRVIVVSNLQPAKLMGVESQGMLLAGETEDGKLKIVEPDNSLKPGTRIR